MKPYANLSKFSSISPLIGELSSSPFIRGIEGDLLEVLTAENNSS
jgi:hypothetical protein